MVADTKAKLYSLVTEFDKVCDRRKLCVSVKKSKMMKFTQKMQILEHKYNEMTRTGGSKEFQVPCNDYRSK